MSVRHAALLMHALSDQDRTWLWERLGDQQRAMLTPLLGELGELGIPRDEALVQEVLSADRAAVREDIREVVSPLDRLDDLPAARVLDLLAGEPDAFVSRLLSLKDWKWRADVARLRGMSDVSPPPCEGSARGDRFVWHAARLLAQRSQSEAETQALQAAVELRSDPRPVAGSRKSGWRLLMRGAR